MKSRKNPRLNVFDESAQVPFFLSPTTDTPPTRGVYVFLWVYLWVYVSVYLLITNTPTQTTTHTPTGTPTETHTHLWYSQRIQKKRLRRQRKQVSRI
jgi:hypothetical protein